MPNYLHISVHFLGDEFHGRCDHDESEWPPSPLRLFQALVAVNARIENQAKDALQWLEQQSPPVIVATECAAIQPSGYKTYVPDNVGDIVAMSWLKDKADDIAKYRTEKLVRPTLLAANNGFPCVHYLWPIEEPAHGRAIASLIPAARAISQLGWGVDLVVADASIRSNEEIVSLTGERWLPSESFGGSVLRIPVVGTLADLTMRYEAFLNRISLEKDAVFRPVPPLSQFSAAIYHRESEMSRPPCAVFALRKPDDSSFAAFASTRRGLHLSGMLRHAASQTDFTFSLGWDKAKVNSFVLGHSEVQDDKTHQPVANARLIFIPLPSVEWRGKERGKTIGPIRRVLVTVKGKIENDDFFRIVRNFEGRELIDEKTKQPVAFLRRQSKRDGAIERYFEESKEWVSVTPVILPGYDDPCKLRRRLNTTMLKPKEKSDIIFKLETRIEFLLRKALRQAGYTEELIKNAQLQWRSAGFMPGTDLASNYAVPDQHRRFRRLHVCIVFERPISGPLCFGGGRFTGLGLFVPIGE
jgi:CRISPR-associated protein Csb2